MSEQETVVIKFPNSASRRIFARRPRRSKNGTPEERAAKQAAGTPVSASGAVLLFQKKSVAANAPTPRPQLRAASAARLRTGARFMLICQGLIDPASPTSIVVVGHPCFLPSKP